MRPLPVSKTDNPLIDRAGWASTIDELPTQLPTHECTFSTQKVSGPYWQVIEGIGRGEWIRTTDLLVPNHVTLAISMITERANIFARNFILGNGSTLVGG